MRIKKLLMVGLVALLSACGSSSGTKITDDQIAQLHVGETTRDQAVALLGKPQSEMISSNGTRILAWARVEVRVRPETMIPIAGAFIGGADSQMTSLALAFGADGKLQQTTNNNSTGSSSLHP